MTTWLWIGFSGMVLGAIAIAVLTTKAPEGERHHGVTSFFVCLIAAAAYLAMAFGQGDITVGGKEIFVARYVDWAVTTPLLLLGLLTLSLPLAKRRDSRERTAFLGSVLGADLFMVVTGLLATISTDSTQKWVWYAISCLGFLYVLYAIWVPCLAAATEQGKGVRALYQRLAFWLTGLWLVYPVLWVLGTEGTGELTLQDEVGAFAVVDVSAKAVFGVLLVSGVIALHGKARKS